MRSIANHDRAQTAALPKHDEMIHAWRVGGGDARAFITGGVSRKVGDSGWMNSSGPMSKLLLDDRTFSAFDEVRRS